MWKRNRKFNGPGSVDKVFVRRSRVICGIGVGAAILLSTSLSTISAQAAIHYPNGMYGYEIDLNSEGKTTASSVSITMGGETTNGELNASSANPNKSAGLVKRSFSVQIGATDGYSVTLSGNPNLTGTNSNNKIPTVTSNTTLAQMNNQWGWYSAEGDVDCSALQVMKPMKSTGDQIATGTLSATTAKQFTMCFGAKVNGNQTADTYSNTVTLSVVAQPKVVRKFGGITTMQEMTSSICSAAAENDTAYLRDTRDNKSYWVTKLKDGNCWMSQNLALDLSTSTTLTSEKSDVSSWTPGHNTSSKPTDGSTTATETWSWNLGDYVITNPTATTACSSNNTGLSTCSGQFTNVSGWTPSSDPNFYREELYSGTDGSTCTKTAATPINPSATGACKVYDAHFLAGNYYQWNAATAGTGGTITDANAAGSICPRNWKLPNSNSTAKNSFEYLLQQYGVNSSLTGTIGNAELQADILYDIALGPLFFVRSGYVETYDHRLEYAGRTGIIWSSRAYPDHDPKMAYALYLATNVSTSNYGGYYYGYSLRCLVPTTK